MLDSEGHAAAGDMPALPPDLMVTSGPELQLNAISGFVALLQPGSVLRSGVPITIEGHMDA